MIDWNQVKRLRHDVGNDAFDEIVDLFIDEVEGAVTKLSEKLEISNLENDMHFLKGSALNLGFIEFSQMCMNGEKMSAGGKAANVDVPAIIDCFYASKTRFMADVTDAF